MFKTIKNLLVRAFGEAGTDNIGLLAAGVTYYAFLAVVPLLAVAVLSYGLIVDPHTVEQHTRELAQMLPAAAAELIGSQLEDVVTDSSGKKGFGLILALAIALFGARNAAGAIVTAVGIAYNQPNNRGFIRSNVVAIIVTLGAIFGAGLTVVATTVLALLQSFLPPAYGATAVLGQVATYAALFAAAVGGAAVLYRFAPHRKRPAWRLVRPGAFLAGGVFLLLTLAFGIYVTNFGNYNATYGSLGAVVVLLTWLYLSAYVLLFGAELNVAFEHPATTP